MKRLNLRLAMKSMFLASVFLSITSSVSADAMGVSVSGKACVQFAGQSTVFWGFEHNETDDSLPPWVEVCGGGMLSITAAGEWGHDPGALSGPEGKDGGNTYTESQYLKPGISRVIAPLNMLVGVFLADDKPEVGSAPPDLELGVDDMTTPQLQQAFAIGAELFDIQVPVGATRLFLGLNDGYEWSNNVGEVYVVVSDPSGTFVTGGGWIEQPAPPLPFFAENCNYYELVEAPGAWLEACAAANATRLGVMGGAFGHLVTITSQAEQDFLYGTFGSSLHGKWYGGFQDPPDEQVANAGWTWVTGELWDYTNWDVSDPTDPEPNDDQGPGSEQYLEGWLNGMAWNDEGHPANASGYVVEYEGADLLTGKANFGFNAKYKKGASVPAGQTEFQFHAGDLNFHSSGYDWLITGPDKAQLKGTGAINGSDGFEFMIWAADGDPDTFRIKIWQDDGFGSEIVIYDTAVDQALGGGSIVIHAK